MGIIAIVLFVIVFILILKGYPVAITLAGVSILCGLLMCLFAPDYFYFNDFKLLAFRLMGTLNNYVLMAIPLFIYMGIMLEKSGLAEGLLETMTLLFGRVPGGMAVSVVIVGGLLAASTGIVGATVVTMGLISLPAMLKRKYNASFASGTIASSGTLGVIIPPSIMLVLLADTINSSNRGSSIVDVGTVFGAALIPGLLLVILYILYIVVAAYMKPNLAPPISSEELSVFRGAGFTWRVIKAFLLPILLIIAVLGSIFLGLASPTEASAIGAMGAVLLTALNRKLNFQILKKVGRETTHITAMVFLILFGATTFTLLFRHLGGDELLIQWITQSNLSAHAFVLLVLLIIFFLGFFIDFIEIIFIIVPVVVPIFNVLDVDILWVSILIALNLQTSFLTPPFGFSLFYLKGVAPSHIQTMDIYKGVIPFILIQLFVLILVFFVPDIVHLMEV